MKNKTVKALALAMAVATVTMMGSASIYASDDTAEAATEETADTEEDADAADTEEASSPPWPSRTSPVPTCRKRKISLAASWKSSRP